MNKESAKRILLDNVMNLQRRRTEVYTQDLETEVINAACLEILKNRKLQSSSSSSLNDSSLRSFTMNSNVDVIRIAQSFTEAALELFPNNYTSREAVVALHGIQINVEWDGMWDSLRDYYQRNHGISIDDVETETIIFYSTRHQRVENGITTSEIEVERTVKINKLQDGKEALFSIQPSLSPKKAKLVNKKENEYTYEGYDPDFRFYISFDNYDEVEKFVLERTDRGLKIIYF